MRAMTRLNAGATFSVLRLYYVQAVRSLVDYCAPVIIALSPNQQERLEVLQNNAMRTMLGAPRWSSACVMQSETSLVPLATRVQCIMACRVARVFRRDVEGVAQRRLRLAMTQGIECLRGNTWLINTSLATHSLIHAGITGPWREADVPPPPTMLPPPWGPPAAEFTATQLPACKAMCTTRELRQHALMAMAQVAERDSRVYFTDGSVDPDSGRTGAAFVTTGGTELSWRTSNTAPHSRLSWCHPARPRTCPAPPGGNCGNTHRLLDGLQALQQPHPKDNVRLINHHPRQPTEPCRAGKACQAHWIPSHVGVRGNEAADAAAKRAASGPSVTMHVPPAYSSSRRRRDGPQRTALTRHTENWEARKRQAAWYAAATDYHPLDATQQTTQGRWRTTAACASGLLHQRGATGGLRGASVRPLRDAHPSPTGALLPNLPRHRPPEARPGPRRPACSHVGVRGNEAADAAAKRAASGPSVTMHVPPSLQQLKAQARRAAAHCAHQTHRELEARKRQAAWYAAATDYHHWTPPSNNQADGALLQRAASCAFCAASATSDAFLRPQHGLTRIQHGPCSLSVVSRVFSQNPTPGPAVLE
ncbi:hypothetical protein GWK47_010216 [Chionoecetes opilio]|uniref:RNase H type-1 domain-containing protein n=1 Tax=Chionoecetes opilio TaxID=41210 RepID=A0A8J4XWG6_CHIOP|nr:hypothetical protein GWK47_010216 [Chionoecetes opilio]